jgi:hypothetical protein
MTEKGSIYAITETVLDGPDLIKLVIESENVCISGSNFLYNNKDNLINKLESLDISVNILDTSVNTLSLDLSNIRNHFITREDLDLSLQNINTTQLDISGDASFNNVDVNGDANIIGNVYFGGGSSGGGGGGSGGGGGGVATPTDIDFYNCNIILNNNTIIDGGGGNGKIENTPIGSNTAALGTFTNISGTQLYISGDASINNMLEVSNNFLVKGSSQLGKLYYQGNTIVHKDNITDIDASYIIKALPNGRVHINCHSTKRISFNHEDEELMFVSSNGNVDISKILTVHNRATIENILDVSNNLIVLGDASINNMLEVSNNLLVKGTSTLGNLYYQNNSITHYNDISDISTNYAIKIAANGRVRINSHNNSQIQFRHEDDNTNLMTIYPNGNVDILGTLTVSGNTISGAGGGGGGSTISGEGFMSNTTNTNVNSFNGISIGESAGENNPGEHAIAIGTGAGNDTQGNTCIAIGRGTGSQNQNDSAIAIGTGAGNDNQGESSIAIGSNAGYKSQGLNSIAIGTSAGYGEDGLGDPFPQEEYCIAIGFESGFLNQGVGKEDISKNSIAIGYQAGYENQGAYSIALGYKAGETSQHIETIILNGSSSALDTTEEEAFYVRPIREYEFWDHVLTYDYDNSGTYEVSCQDKNSLCDDRYKSRTTDLEPGSLNIINQMSVKKYLLHPSFEVPLGVEDSDLSGVKTKESIGVIAQELEQIQGLERVVYTKTNNQTNKTKKRVDYDALNMYLLAGVQELHNMVVDDLSNNLFTANNRIIQLEAENNNMKVALNELLTEAGKQTI